MNTDEEFRKILIQLGFSKETANIFVELIEDELDHPAPVGEKEKAE